MTNKSIYTKALTLYLLSSEVRDPLDAIANSLPIPDLYSLNVIPGIEWALCIKNSNGKRPEWSNFFRNFFEIEKFGLNSSVSAVLVIPNCGRHWAVTFGHGRFLLREGIVEERFGLRTALNAVDREKIRAIDKETFDSFASQARQQATDDTEFGNFGVNVDRDLLYAVTGVPRESKLGRRLSGKDALCTSVKVPITGLPEYLSLVFSVYESGAYKDEGFGWVDNLYEVRDKAQKRQLDAQLVEDLRANRIRNAWLAAPEILDWQKVMGFSYANPSPPFSIGDVHLSTFLSSFQLRGINLDVIALKRSRVVCLNHDGETIHRWNAYRCLYAEVAVEGKIFLLTNGHWYKISEEIVTDVERWYEKLMIDTTLLPEMKMKEREDDYNKRLGMGGVYHLFHGNLVYLPNNRGTIEFCDLAAQREGYFDLIHVKRFGPSSKLSHLFFQGTNSARLFRTSPEFREALSSSASRLGEISKRLLSEPPRLGYRVVFAIASSSTTRLELPLFSKLSLRQALRELEGLGFRVAVAKIAAPEEERKMKIAKRSRKTF
ncbi:MAG: TIGR04141 family sporadically distributed protein [Thermoanaerobaculia bacterium]